MDAVGKRMTWMRACMCGRADREEVEVGVLRGTCVRVCGKV